MTPVRPPTKNPCGSCPYRRDVPSGVWHPDEYAKLPEFDRPMAEQPPSIFLCHQQNGRLCSGWVGCHDMDDSLGVRIGVLTGTIDPDDLDTIRDYTTATPLFDSGTEAARHGMAEVPTPGDDARRVVAKLEHRRERRESASSG